MLLSLAPSGTEFKVNTFTTGTQALPAIAMDADGDFVMAWQSNGQDPGGSTGVFAQRFNSAGVAQGAEFHVNTFTPSTQAQAAVAMDADGDFVIAWNSSGQDSASSVGVYAQRYNAAGVPQGGEFRVNTFTTGDQFVTGVAMNASGDFVMAWQSNSQEGATNAGIYAQRYNFAGQPQGSEFHVNTFTTGFQSSAAVAMDASGEFVITWYSDGQDGSNYGVYAKRYSAAGAEQAPPRGVALGLGNEFRVNTLTTNAQAEPSVAMDYAGNFVIAWHSLTQDGNSYGVFAKRYNAAGQELVPPGGVPVGLGNEFRVNTNTSRGQASPSVATDADGDFLVSWQSFDQEAALSHYGIYAQQYNSAGATVGSEFRVNTFTTNRQVSPAVASDANGDCVVSWYGFGQQDTSGYGIYAQQYDESNPDTAPPMVGGLFFGGNAVMPDQEFTEVIASMVLSFSEDMSVAGGTSGTNSATNPANYVLLKNGTDVSGLINSATFGFNSTTRKFEAVLTFSFPLLSGDYVIGARDTLRDLSGNALDGDFDGAPGGNSARAFSSSVQIPFGPEFRVNTFTTGAQGGPAAAMDADGDFVVVWAGNGQGDADGIFAQRFNGAGAKEGPEFRVNTTTTGIQSNPAIAMDNAGNFVVVWAGVGVVAQRYNTQGVAQGGEIIVGSGISPDVAMDPDGDFVVTWIGAPIVARQYNALGQPQGGQFTVNTSFSEQYTAPSVAIDDDGDFVIVWVGRTQNQPPPPPPFPPSFTSAMGARQFGASGVGGPQFNPTGTTNAGDFPDVGMDSDGNFVITWASGLNSISARRFDSGGTPGAIFPVVTSSEFVGAPAIAMDGAGEFVITWSSTPFSPEPESDVEAQRFSAAAELVGAVFPVNTFTAGNQASPTVAMSESGNIVFAWSSDIQDPGGSPGVYGQLIVSSTPSPHVDDSAFVFATLPHRMQVKFNQNVAASLGTNDIVLENLTTGQTIPSSDLSMTYDAATNTATFSYTGNASGITSVLPDGNYRATLLASGIFSEGGAPLEANHVFNFFFLNGDANHDGRVNLADFNIVAANFGQFPRDFTQGDFNYDTAVFLSDFNILAARFGSALAPLSFTASANHDDEPDLPVSVLD